MCARLNDSMVVDGCITQDSDCFLYGAKTVYRNFSAACSSKGAGFAVDSYDMLRIQELLGLDREALVALALLCGCDYQDGSESGARGVAGIGIEKASQLIIGLSKMFGNVLYRLKSWKSDSYYCKLEEEVAAVESGTTCILCGHRGSLGRHDRAGCKSCGSQEGCEIKKKLPKENSLLSVSVEKRKLLMLELKVRAKAVTYPGFPSQAIIDEFLAPVPFTVPLKPSDISWNQPNLTHFLDIAEKYLGWQQDYSLAKFLPLLTRWKVMQGTKAQEVMHPYDVQPSTIKKKRISKGVLCFEVEWKIVPKILETTIFSTLEPVYLFEKAYSLLSEEFLVAKCKGKGKPKVGGGKSTIKNKTSKGCSCSGRKRGHICQFFDKKSSDNSNSTTEEKDSALSSAIISVTEMLGNTSIKNDNSFSSDEEPVSDLDDDDFDPLELSAIINGIVEGNSSSHEEHGVVTREKELLTKCNMSEPWDSRLTSDDVECEDNLFQVEFIKETKSTVAEMCVYDEDIKVLCQQLEHVDLEKITKRDEVDKNSTDDDELKVTPAMEGRSSEPNFDLGTSVFLQSP
ncbi:flap endonuclease GEN isoform X2 [Ischnura elegans]|nr:flap endonuclease GEN isoform X2 [Ischnura elegans]